MSYVKQTWVNYETRVDAEHLNHMEDGIASKQDAFTVGEGLQMDGDVLGVVPEGKFETVAETTLEEDVAYYTWAQDVEYKKLLIKLEQPPVDGYETATNKASYIWLGEVINQNTIAVRIGELPHSTYTMYTSVSLECKNGRLFCDADTSRNIMSNNAVAYTSSFLNNGMVECDSIKKITIGNINGTLYAGLKIKIEGVRADA